MESRTCNLRHATDTRGIRNVQDGSGAIDQDELMAALNKLGVMVSEDEVVVMMRQADVDGNGEIDIDEFVSIFIDN